MRPMRVVLILLFLIPLASALRFSHGTPDKMYVLQDARSAEWNYFLSHEGPDMQTIHVSLDSGLLGEYASINQELFDLIPNDLAEIIVRIDLPRDFPPGIYPVRVLVGEDTSNGKGFATSMGAQDVRTVIVPSQESLLIPNIAAKDNYVIIGFRNIGLVDTEDVRVEVDIIRDSDNITRSFLLPLVPALEGRQVVLDFSGFGGELSISGDAFYGDAIASFREVVLLGRPEFRVEFPERIVSREDVSVGVFLQWNRPLLIENPLLTIRKNGHFVFSHILDSVVLQPGLNVVGFDGVINVDESSLVSAELQFGLNERMRIFNSDVFIEVEPSLSMPVAMISENAVQHSNLNYVLLAIVMMLFALCLVMFKKERPRLIRCKKG